MIRSKTAVSVIPQQPAILKTVFITSVLEIRNGEYITTTSHYYEEGTRKILIYTGTDLYTNQQINDMYTALKPQIENLPFTEQIEAGIEMVLLDWFNTHEMYGIPANTDGWEII